MSERNGSEGRAVFLTAEWRKLAMVQYAVNPEVLLAWVPPGVELDLYQGRCYVSLVGFLFDDVRVKGWAVPFHRRFPEVNLRFYVARTERDGTRKRGVVFVREFVPRAAITIVARTLYEEPYSTLRMRYAIAETADAVRARYVWRAGRRWHRLEVEGEAGAKAIAAESQEEFVTEHYWGYTKRSRGPTSEYGVEHPRWVVYPVRSLAVDVDFGQLYGPGFAALNREVPASVLLAEGSAVQVRQGARLG